jgi:hypothetical protein
LCLFKEFYEIYKYNKGEEILAGMTCVFFVWRFMKGG